MQSAIQPGRLSHFQPIIDFIRLEYLEAMIASTNRTCRYFQTILTSMLKRVDVAVFDTIKAEKEGKFSGGLKSFGLADKGIDYAVDTHNEKLVAMHKEKIEKVRDDIVSGKIKVPDYYEIQKVK